MGPGEDEQGFSDDSSSTNYGDSSADQNHGSSEGGWLDQAFGLDPHKSFVEDVMNPLIGHAPDGMFTPAADDSTLDKLGKAAGIVATMPLWGPAVISAACLDEINHAPLGLYGHELEGNAAENMGGDNGEAANYGNEEVD